MLKGRDITVELRERDVRDSFGNDVESYAAPVGVHNVLVAPGTCKELDASRPEGVEIALTLHFPKTWTGDLRGAKVGLAGEYGGSYRVVGAPYPYQRELCPTDWCMAVEAERIDG